jgi:hypothetical protein
MLSALTGALLISDQLQTRMLSRVKQYHHKPEYESMFHQDCRTSESIFRFLLSDSDLSPYDGGFHEFDCFSFPGESYRSSIGVDATAPKPFGEDDLARASKRPLFPVETCSSIVREAEVSAKWRSALRFATYNSHGRHPAEFCSVQDLPIVKALLETLLLRSIFPAISNAFPTVPALSTPSFLRATGAQVVKYNASAGVCGSSELGVHRDGPLVACVVSLNDVDQYEGGGTFIEALMQRPINEEPSVSSSSHTLTTASCSPSTTEVIPEELGASLKRGAGHLVMHPGYIRHGGAAVTKGVRYVLVVWVLSTAYFDAGHYATLKASSLLARALQVPRTSQSGFRHELLHAAIEEYRGALSLEQQQQQQHQQLQLASQPTEITPKTKRQSPAIGSALGEHQAGEAPKSEASLTGLAQAIIEMHLSAKTLQPGPGGDNNNERLPVTSSLDEAVLYLKQSLRMAPKNSHVKSLTETVSRLLSQQTASAKRPEAGSD